jgi:hypothetical protein
VQSGANQKLGERANVCSCGRTWHLALELRPVETPRLREHKNKSSSDRVGLPARTAISMGSTIMVRAQQAVDRWNAAPGQTSFEAAMLAEAKDFGGTIPPLDLYRRAFLSATMAIHEGVGHAFSNPAPLLCLIQNLGVENTEL